MKKTSSQKLILASKSPRRKSLLEQMGIQTEIRPSNIDESSIHIKEPETLVKKLAQFKAQAVASAYPAHWILGADTVVTMQDLILGKPADQEDAAQMLRKLSGCHHEVYTGYCLTNQDKDQTICRAIRTKVWFKTLSETEIRWYVSTGEAMDKAGAYGIQGIGAFLVEKINGSYSNVVGLPVCEVFNDLTTLNIIKLEH